MSPAESVLSRFEKVRRNGSGWQAQCPAHEDKNPSLSVSEGSDGTVLVKCHAGCDTAAVLAAVGLEVKDLFPPKDKPEIEATYDYTDEDGNLLSQVVRYRPKDFRNRRPGGHGEPEWVWKLGDTRRVLYRLPEVLREREHVYVVEGEKDADALAAAGLTATTCLGGAGKWRDTYTGALAGCQTVTVIADRDEPGRAHARDVASSITRAGQVQNVEVVQPPEGCKDISDMLAQGLKRDALEPVEDDHAVTAAEKSQVSDSQTDQRVQTPPTRRVRLIRADSIKPKPVYWLWERRIPVGELALTPGRGGIGKSTFHSWLTAQVTRGTLPGDFHGEPRAVIIMTTEDSWAQTIVPRLMAAEADMGKVYRADVVTESDEETTLTLPSDGALLADQIHKVGAAMVSLDPLLSTIAANLDTHKNSEVRQALEPLKRIADATRCTVLGNAHFNKGRGSDPLTLVTGSGAFGDVPRAVLGFARDEDTDEYVATQVKNNLGRLDLPSLRYTIEETEIPTDEGPARVGRLVWRGESSRTIYEILNTRDDEKGDTDRAAEWLESVLSEGPEAKADVVKWAKSEGIAVRTVERAAEKIRVISDRDETRRGRPSTWSLPDYPPTATTKNGLADKNPNGDGGSSGYPPPRDVGGKPKSEATGEPLPDPFETAIENLDNDGFDFTEEAP